MSRLRDTFVVVVRMHRNAHQYNSVPDRLGAREGPRRADQSRFIVSVDQMLRRATPALPQHKLFRSGQGHSDARTFRGPVTRPGTSKTPPHEKSRSLLEPLCLGYSLAAGRPALPASWVRRSTACRPSDRSSCATSRIVRSFHTLRWSRQYRAAKGHDPSAERCQKEYSCSRPISGPARLTCSTLTSNP